MEINEYVRTKDGKIGKYIQPESGKSYITNGISFNEGANYGKHSKDIIKLLEKGDYVNGHLVIEVDKTNSSVIIDHKIDEGTYDSFYNDDGWDSRYIEDWVDERLYNYDIETVLTHEQFESNAYKIEKEV